MKTKSQGDKAFEFMDKVDLLEWEATQEELDR